MIPLIFLVVVALAVGLFIFSWKKLQGKLLGIVLIFLAFVGVLAVAPLLGQIFELAAKGDILSIIVIFLSFLILLAGAGRSFDFV